jgi:hypothetical protein
MGSGLDDWKLLVATAHKSLSGWKLESFDHTAPPAELTALHCLGYSDFVI